MRKVLPKHMSAQFEPCDGNRPHAVMSRHPSDGAVALEASAGFRERVAVWSEHDGKLLWRPENAVALCWLPEGQRILGIIEDADGEYGYALRLWSWPGRKPIATWPIGMPGWCYDLVVSSDGTKASATWLEQDGAGFFLLPLDVPPGKECQQDGADYECTESNLLVGPIFSPDGRYLIAAWTQPIWWAPRGDPETPSPGGRFEVGKIVVFDCRSWDYRETAVAAEVKPGWHPGGESSDSMLGAPEFIGDGHFAVTLPTEEKRVFALIDLVPGT